MSLTVSPELLASQYVHAGDLPKIPGWNRTTNQQVAKALNQSLYYRKAGGVTIPTIGNVTGPKQTPGVQLEQKIGDPTFERFARSSQNIGSRMDKLETEIIISVNAYYREAISESQLETERVRLVKIVWYEKDNTFSISEPKQVNSGLPQGSFLSRQVLRREDGSTRDSSDLRIGTMITIFGKTFFIYSCDGFTRNWYEENGNPQPDDLAAPEVLDRIDYKSQEWAGKVMFPAKTFMEASLGKHMHDSEGMAKFLKYDQDSLRFALAWDNTKTLFGDYLTFTMNYFLADDTVTITQSKVANSGMGFFPRLLNRERLLKNHEEYLQLHEREVGHHHGPGAIWSWKEFRIGTTLNIFGRQMRIAAMDPNARRFYEQHGIEQGPNEYEYGEKANRPELQPPPYTGYGDKEDSDLNWKRLLPKQPKKDYNQFIGKDGQVLRYTAKLVSSNPDDRMRNFVITYFLNDDTLRVFEPSTRNSGIVGGRFLMKKKYLNPEGEFINPLDIRVGANLILNKFEFEILTADNFTKDFLERMSKK